MRYGTYGNNLRQHRWQLQAYAQWKPLARATLVANVTLTDNHARNVDAALRQHTTSAFYYLSLTQQLPWRLLASAYTYGQAGHSPMGIYAYTRSYNAYAFSLQRSFLSDDRLTMRLSANMPFQRYQRNKTRTTQGDIMGWGDNTNNASGRYFRISLSYRFGRLNASVKKTETTIENNDVVGGIIKGN